MNFIRFLCGLGVCTALALGCSKSAPPAAQSGPPVVTVALPKVAKVTRYADLTGQTDAAQTVQVRPRVSGFITRVDMIDGQNVIGEITLWGMVIREGTLLFEIDPVTYDADLKQAQAQVSQMDAKLKLAEANRVAEKELVDKGASTQLKYAPFVAEVEVAQANLNAAKQSVIKAEQNLGWTHVTAPISGKVDRAYLTAGNVVTGGMSQGTVLTTIVSLRPMYVYFDVDDQTVLAYKKLVREKKAVSAENGETVPVNVQLKGETGYPHPGLIDFVSNRLNPSTGSLQIRATFPNEDDAMAPGLFVKGQVPIGEPQESILIPDEAVIADQGQKVVYIVNEKNVVEARVVQAGPMAYGLRVVEGLAATDRVIIKGFQRVRPGVEVTPETGTIKTEDEKKTL